MSLGGCNFALELTQNYSRHRHELFLFQITQLKIENNPFAKGFRGTCNTFGSSSYGGAKRKLEEDPEENGASNSRLSPHVMKQLTNCSSPPQSSVCVTSSPRHVIHHYTTCTYVWLGYTRKNAQLVTNLLQTCSKSAATTC